LPSVAQAAGLGKITVFSALGQPLRAEVELSATREELSGMKAQLASQDAFRLAGLDYVTTLAGIRFAIDKRANGQPVIKLNSDKPVIDPFVDMLLELNWATGRLVREYTFLLDPPEMADKAAVVETPSGYQYTESNKTAAELAAHSILANPARDNAPLRASDGGRQPIRGGDTHQVKQGDTLSKIASAMKPEGVSLEQMLVGLFRANRDAFNGNMNRLKAGKILSVPEKSDLEAVAPSEAKKIVLAQSADWNAYRRNLAGAAAQAALGKEESGKREAAGKVTAKVEDKAAPSTEPKDQLKVSKAETAAAKRTEEDLIAREKALREANDRVSGLEKNVEDLQKLVELKNQSLAVLQKQLAAKAAPVEPAKPVEAAVKPVEPKNPELETKPQLVAPVETASVPALAVPLPVAEKPDEGKPVEPSADKSAEAAASEAKVEPQPQPETKPADVAEPKPEQIVPPPEEEPDFVEELIDNPVLLAGGGGILALLAAFFLIKRRRQSPQKDDLPPAVRSALSARSSLGGKSTLAPQSGASVPNSVFHSTGGQTIDTSFVPPPSDFSQAGPGTIDTDEVDPVAEADVYMAYGRDAQAEEILLEAKQKDPKRHAIHLKLLEIYANRKNINQFETLATDFYGETGGVGAEWEKAAAMGLKLDPKNPLFGGAGHEVEPKAAAQPPLSPLEFGTDTVEPTTAVVEPQVAAPVVEPVAVAPAVMPKEIEQVTAVLPPAALDTAPLDFDFSDSPPLPVTHSEPEPLSIASNALDFSLPDAIPAAEPVVTAEPQKLANGSDLDFDLEFDVKMTESTVLGQPMQSPSFEMTSINLDLDDFAAGGTSRREEAASEPVLASDFGQFEIETKAPQATEKTKSAKSAMAWDQPDPQDLAGLEPFAEIEISSNEEVATKLDLANAYEEMGDLEGVRELLQEVLKEGDTTQREKAQAILARINQ
jgi:pilus assembly protein FimV